MKNKLLRIAVLTGLAMPLYAAPLTESTFTEIVKDVQVVAGPGKTTTPAEANELLKAPDRVRTGPESRAELTAPDQTITRVGANTVFSFADSGRTLNLEQGNVLFHAPKGIGGGTIRSGGVVAAVLGTTLIVSVTPDGGFKVILLEGSGTVTLPNGQTVTLHAGQMVYVLPSGTTLSRVLDINLGKLTGGSALVHGFSHPLSSQPLIDHAIEAQNTLLASGEAEDTGMSPDNSIRKRSGNGMGALDPGAYQAANHPSYTLQLAEKTAGAAINGTHGPGGRTLTTHAP